MMYNGDTALVGSQYSYLPSWISFLGDQQKSMESGRLMINTIHDRWLQVPLERRPKLVLYGESLGSMAGQGAFGWLPDIARMGFSSVLWVGPPNASPLWRGITVRRDPGTLVEPRYDNGRTVRFSQATDAKEIADDAAPPWDGTRVLFLQHPSDPIVWWSPDLLFSRPDWLVEPPGRDRTASMRWYPIVTFWQVSADGTNAASVPGGHGHNYGDSVLDGWAAVAPPTDGPPTTPNASASLWRSRLPPTDPSTSASQANSSSPGVDTGRGAGRLGVAVKPRMSGPQRPLVQAGIGTALAVITRAPLGWWPPALWSGVRLGLTASAAVPSSSPPRPGCPRCAPRLQRGRCRNLRRTGCCCGYRSGVVRGSRLPRGPGNGRDGSVRRPVGPAACGAFGLWHIADARSTGAPVIGTVLVTGTAGWLFGSLRESSGSLAAPVLAHLAINEAGAIAAAPAPLAASPVGALLAED